MLTTLERRRGWHYACGFAGLLAIGIAAASPPAAPDAAAKPAERRDGEESIYVPRIPPQSAFVRLFNGTPRELMAVRLGGETFREVNAYSVTAFATLPAGAFSINVDGTRHTFQLEKNRHYTAALTPDALRLVDDQRNSNRMKALVVFHNLLDGIELSLRTADGSTTVIDRVAPRGRAAREVNAVKTALALYRGGDRVAALPLVVLERGRAFQLFVAGSPDQPVPVWVVN